MKFKQPSPTVNRHIKTNRLSAILDFPEQRFEGMPGNTINPLSQRLMLYTFLVFTKWKNTCLLLCFYYVYRNEKRYGSIQQKTETKKQTDYVCSIYK